MSMRAVEILANDAGGMLRCGNLAIPKPAAGEVLIRVAYAGVNRADVFQRQGLYPPPEGASLLPGLEVSGEVVEVGTGCSRYRVGDSVCALLAGGGYAQYCTAAEALTLPLPRGLELRDAAAIAEAWFTVWMALVEKAAIQVRETLLVHGGASGVGTAAIQLARLLGAEVYATAGSEAKCAACTELGARAICYREQDFAEIIRRETGGRGVDVVLDMVGGVYFRKHLSLLAPRGRLVMIAFLQGTGMEASLAPVLFKELTLTGFSLRGQPLMVKERIARKLEEKCWPAFAEGKIKPLIDKEFALEDAILAHKRMENNLNIGKILLKVAHL